LITTHPPSFKHPDRSASATWRSQLATGFRQPVYQEPPPKTASLAKPPFGPISFHTTARSLQHPSIVPASTCPPFEFRGRIDSDPPHGMVMLTEPRPGLTRLREAPRATRRDRPRKIRRILRIDPYDRKTDAAIGNPQGGIAASRLRRNYRRVPSTRRSHPADGRPDGVNR